MNERLQQLTQNIVLFFFYNNKCYYDHILILSEIYSIFICITSEIIHSYHYLKLKPRNIIYLTKLFIYQILSDSQSSKTRGQRLYHYRPT